MPCRIGCAGWSLPRDSWPRFGPGASHLHRYGSRLCAVEINSSFYRPHQHATYARWADSVPEHFAFSVKLPGTITHERRLVDCEDQLDAFAAQVGGLGDKLGCVLVQLPPSLAFDARLAGRFMTGMRLRFAGPIAIEPRHASWFTTPADAMLAHHRVARVLADPVRHPGGRMPGGWHRLVYLRLHGSPRMYYSRYGDGLLGQLAARIAVERGLGHAVWCIFDNTAHGAATHNALNLASRLPQTPP